jgi:TRAP-type C4-dicarboxylate transport system permease small subunit
MSKPITKVPALDAVLIFSIVSVPRFIIGSLVLFGIAVNFGNVVGRYVFLSPIIWAEEIMIYIMVWTVFVGSILVTWEGRHLRMDFFTIMLPSPFKEILNFLGVITFIVVCFFVLPQNWKVVDMMFRLDQRSVVSEIPMVIPHFALLMGFSLMLVAIVFRFRSHVMGNLESEVDELVADHGEDQSSSGER